ncbi:MAG: hypothetical protein ACOX0Z_03795 [Candidatus Nanosyncoccaceae bacterium]|jgi:ABC-type uncharacterized transport system permease subunit
MSIYKVDIKELRKVFHEFHQTLYGKTVFFLAYIIPVGVLFASAVALIVGTVQESAIILSGVAKLLCAFGVAFVLGNIYYYAEIRKFCEHKEKSVKKK